MRRAIKKRRGGARGEPWQVIYMDLMTIIMVFFVILWSINQREEEGVSAAIGDTTVNTVSLPGDVLFGSGEERLSKRGRKVFRRLFADESGSVLDFDTGGLVDRVLVIHGHTDGDGKKNDNLELGYKRAFSVYEEIRKFGDELSDHVVLCTHADNSPDQLVPAFAGKLSKAEHAAIKEAKKRNRRIEIEDKIVSRLESQ